MKNELDYFIPLDELEDRCIAMRVHSAIIYCYPFVEEVAKHGAKIMTASGKVVKHVQPAMQDDKRVIVGELEGERLVWDIDGNSASGDETLRLCIPERYYDCNWKSRIKLSNSEWCLKYQREHKYVKIPDAWAEKARRIIND